MSEPVRYLTIKSRMETVLFNKNILATLVIVSLTACGDGGADGDTSTPPPEKKPESVGEALKLLDQSGKLPTLNRDNTILGPDTNNNNVRDDIEAYVASLPDSPPQKEALLQRSASLTFAMMAEPTDESAIVEGLNMSAHAAACLFVQYDADIATEKAAEIKKLTINTRERFTAFAAFDAATNGHSVVLPQGDGCDK